MKPHLSDSKVQRDIEKIVLTEYENHHSSWQKVDLSSLSAGKELAKKVKPDAIWRDDDGVIIIAECYVRIGKLKPGHRRKIATDVLKLISLRNEFGIDHPPRLLLVIPDELGPQLVGNDWLSMVIAKQITLVKVQLTDQQRKELLKAVKCQGEGQAHSAKSDVNPPL